MRDYGVVFLPICLPSSLFFRFLFFSMYAQQAALRGKHNVYIISECGDRAEAGLLHTITILLLCVSVGMRETSHTLHLTIITAAWQQAAMDRNSNRKGFWVKTAMKRRQRKKTIVADRSTALQLQGNYKCQLASVKKAVMRLVALQWCNFLTVFRIMKASPKVIANVLFSF